MIHDLIDMVKHILDGISFVTVLAAILDTVEGAAPALASIWLAVRIYSLTIDIKIKKKKLSDDDSGDGK